VVTVTPRDVVAQVVDPELPMLTLEDLGVLRDVEVDDDTVLVTLTPTYSGCPALATMRADVLVALRRAGYERAEVRTTLSPAWSSDWISPRGRAALAEHGISPPGPVVSRPHGFAAGGAPSSTTVFLGEPTVLEPVERTCPLCGSSDIREVSRFGSTSCRSLHTCRVCGETFDHMKEI
jgi:ring-1,2-phenylacetyl-CoA epoxidase subunit PaaD